MTKIFLSYCSQDKPIADIIEKELVNLSNGEILVSRYTILEYRDSIGDFMNSITEHDYVFSIISDSYLKSVGCMYEIDRVIDTSDFAKKMFWVILDEDDRIYYKENSGYVLNVANIYGGATKHTEYIKYWKARYEELLKIKDEIGNCLATQSLIEEIRKCKHIYEDDIGKFLDFLANGIGCSFNELYSNHFKVVFEQVFPEWEMDMFEETYDYKKLFSKAINEIIKVTKNDYTQIILSVRVDSYYSARVVFAEKISCYKVQFKRANNNGVTEKCFALEKTINIPDVSVDEDYQGAEKTTQSELIIPVKIMGKTIGVINSESEYKNYYSQDMCVRLEMIANRLGLALHKLGFNSLTHIEDIGYLHL